MAKTKERVILVVDDNSDHRKGFRILLESGGYSRVECKSGSEALTAVEKHHDMAEAHALCQILNQLVALTGIEPVF
jgi:CheY-like chemotaxis protein